MIHFFRPLGFMLLAIVISFISQAGPQKAKSVDYAKEPAWITMMDDSTVNYFEALKAYETYWKHHEKPEDEEELMNEGKEKVEEKRKEHAKKISVAEKEAEVQMRYQCKRFEDWKHEVFPFVQPDGRILTQAERVKIWNDQQQQLKDQEKKK